MKINTTTEPTPGAKRAAYALLNHPEITCGVFAHLAEEFAAIIDREKAANELLGALELSARLVKAARRYFPKSMKNPDKSVLEITSAAISTAIGTATKGRT